MYRCPQSRTIGLDSEPGSESRSIWLLAEAPTSALAPTAAAAAAAGGSSGQGSRLEDLTEPLGNFTDLEPVSFGPLVPRGASLVDAAGFLRTLPFRDALDGFFAAMLVRRR